jgi:hypothetical protein
VPIPTPGAGRKPATACAHDGPRILYPADVRARASARLLPIAILGLVACSPGSSADADAEPQGVLGELVIELQPVDEVALAPLFMERTFDAPGRPRLRADASLSLAIGEGYPTTIDVVIGDAWDVSCGQLRGAIEILDVQATGVDVLQQGASGLRISIVDPAEPGDHPTTIIGTLRLDPTMSQACAEHLGGATELDLEIALDVGVRRPATIVIERPAACANADALRMHTNVPLSGWGIGTPVPLVSIFDESGEPLWPDNATRQRPATVTVRGSESTRLHVLGGDEGAGLGGLVVDGPAGTIEVTADLADTLALEVVSTDRIDAMDVVFALPGAAGGATVLEDGVTLGEGGWARTFDRVVPLVTEARVDGDPLCTAIDPAALELRSDTPSTCVPEAWPSDHDLGVLPDGTPAPSNALVAASGTCTLELAAVAANGGAGLVAPLSVTLLEVESLHSLSGASGR